MFEDRTDKVLDILLAYDKDLKAAISKSPPLTLKELSQVGYYGFREATLIEPFWNAYFLGIVISIAEEIEKKRISEDEKKVFSYRYQWNEADGSLFKDSTWIDYKMQCIKYSESFEYILQTDISNFYPRINHHRLENELERIDPQKSVARKIMSLLGVFSNSISYGLPVGGPASRILAELALNSTDLYLNSEKILFCRYADDYTIFCTNESDAYEKLIILSKELSHIQLSLQKDKTKIMKSDEFRDIHSLLDPNKGLSFLDDEQKLLNISIRYDPYSASADEDYTNLKEAIREIDIIGILSKEVNKTRIDQTIAKQAINAIKIISKENQVNAIKILLDLNNLTTLSPVFTTIMRSVRSIYEELNITSKDFVDQSLISLMNSENFLNQIDLNISYMLQILAIRHSLEKEEIFLKLFKNTENLLIKRQIIVALSNWNLHYRLTKFKSDFVSRTIWERRVIIYASYFLGDEGEHWRKITQKFFNPEEDIVNDWCKSRKEKRQLILV
ncbi:MAG: RNA-directed DNA polymerase [Ignavibacteriaceae bacterium]|nr:RNA-directed DNA polymerase [Ignavibacteriaceae bacterium]